MDDFGNSLDEPNWKAALYFWFGNPSSEVNVAFTDVMYQLH